MADFETEPPSVTCRSCDQMGHMARDCPDKPVFKCFNCDEEGHSKADCPNPRVFKGACRVCDEEGHFAAECPKKPAAVCFNCKETGHDTGACTNKRVMHEGLTETMADEEAWEMLLQADEARDLDELRKAFDLYCKVTPEAKYEVLEKAFRASELNVHLIALTAELSKNLTNVNLQGERDKTYSVGFFWSATPKRMRTVTGWPKDPTENMERLKDAGVPMERGIQLCSRCGEPGHFAKACPENAGEDVTNGQPQCANCDQPGHRLRSCKAPRKNRFACRNCGQNGHKAEDCTEPRDMSSMQCRKCEEMGHMSKDCPKADVMTCRNCGEEGHMSKECEKPKNPDNVKCFNCEQVGHFTRDCPEPKDWSKVKCNQCGEMGHTIKRCSNAAAATVSSKNDFTPALSFENSDVQDFAAPENGVSTGTKTDDTFSWLPTIEPTSGSFSTAGGGGW